MKTKLLQANFDMAALAAQAVEALAELDSVSVEDIKDQMRAGCEQTKKRALLLATAAAASIAADKMMGV